MRATTEKNRNFTARLLYYGDMMKGISMKLTPQSPIFFIYSFLFVLCVVPCMGYAQIPYEKYQLNWSDEFDVDGLPNSANWGYEEGCSVRNKELQNYMKARIENSHIENGILTIEARKETKGSCNYTSANLVSNGKRSFKYGLFEMRAKIDIRSGSWPAWWWLPSSGGWPKGGEIDMMEFYQGKLLLNVMDGNQKWTSKTQAVSAIGGSAWADTFHVWTWEWDSTKIDLWLDGKLMNHYPLVNADGTGPGGGNPFRQPGYMLVNQAIGGNNGGDPSGTTFPVKYQVDYIRYYQAGKDTTAPKVVSVVAAPGTITVVFSKSVEKTSAEKAANYTVGAAGITISSAKLQSDERTVALAASGLGIGDHGTLTIKNISDRSTPANVLASVTKDFTVVRTGAKLTGTVIGNGDPYNGDNTVVYGKAIDGNTSTFSDCSGSPVWVGYDFGQGVSYVITGFRYYPRDGYSDRMNGKSFEISTDGTTWEKVYTIAAAPTEGSFTTVTIADTKPVRYVRYNGTGGYLNVCEVEFLGYSPGSAAAFQSPGSLVGIAAGMPLGKPFSVTCHSLDGKLLGAWTVENQSDAVSFDRLPAKGASSQVVVVTVKDVDGRQIRSGRLLVR
jgi:beta-glucanase (GH16 family)